MRPSVSNGQRATYGVGVWVVHGGLSPGGRHQSANCTSACKPQELPSIRNPPKPHHSTLSIITEQSLTVWVGRAGEELWCRTSTSAPSCAGATPSTRCARCILAAVPRSNPAHLTVSPSRYGPCMLVAECVQIAPHPKPQIGSFAPLLCPQVTTKALTSSLDALQLSQSPQCMVPSQHDMSFTAGNGTVCGAVMPDACGR